MRNIWRSRFNPRVERVQDAIYLSAGAFTASDDFSGVYPNSGSVGDSYWNSRWTHTLDTATGGLTIAGGALQVRATNGGGTHQQITCNAADRNTDDFTVSVDLSGVVVSSGAGGFASVDLLVEVAGGFYTCRFVDVNGTKTFRVMSTGGSVDYTEANSSTSGTFEIQKSGTNLIMKLDGTTKHTYTSFSTNITNIIIENYVQTSGNQADADYDNFTLLDGYGNPVLI